MWCNPTAYLCLCGFLFVLLVFCKSITLCIVYAAEHNALSTSKVYGSKVSAVRLIKVYLMCISFERGGSICKKRQMGVRQCAPGRSVSTVCCILQGSAVYEIADQHVRAKVKHNHNIRRRLMWMNLSNPLPHLPSESNFPIHTYMNEIILRNSGNLRYGQVPILCQRRISVLNVELISILI